FHIAPVGSFYFLVFMQSAHQLKGLLMIGALEEKLSTRRPSTAVAPARARVVAFLGQCSGHRHDDRVINTVAYAVEVRLATELEHADNAPVDWMTPGHVPIAASLWGDRDAPHFVSEFVRYHRMASFVVGNGLASPSVDRFFLFEHS